MHVFYASENLQYWHHILPPSPQRSLDNETCFLCPFTQNLQNMSPVKSHEDAACHILRTVSNLLCTGVLNAGR